jgi:hypothetical protein
MPFIDHKTMRLVLNQRFPGIVWGDGSPVYARTMLLGMMPSLNEKLPFTVGPSMYLRHVLGSQMGVPKQLIYYNYIVKRPLDMSRTWDEWTAYTREEIRDHLQPPAVVCLGLHVANQILDLNINDVQHLRKTRLYDAKLPRTNFFVTHDPATVVTKEDASDDRIGREFVEDLTAVFEVKNSHFMKTRDVTRKNSNATGEPVSDAE